MNGLAASAVRPSPFFRLLFLAFLVALLHVPILAMALLVRERQIRRDSAVEEVSSKWGRQQALTGPALVVPYRVTRTVQRGNAVVVETSVAQLTILPEALRVDGRLEPETRKRGIFSIPVYTLDLAVDGNFAPPDLDALGIAPEDVDWSRAELSVGINDVRAIQKQVVLSWQGEPVEFLPGPGKLAGVAAGLHAPVAVARGEEGWKFSLPLRLHGSVGVTFTPVGKQSDVTLASTWPSPSFVGEYLPVNRQTGKDGFTASWSVPYLGRNLPQAWTSTGAEMRSLGSTAFGLDLLQPVDTYRMVDRSLKYAWLFLSLTLLAVWLAEVLAGISVHPIPSLLLCTALCAFYLLELSLAEHVGFGPAYAIAAAAVTAMVGAYGKVALGRWSWALGLAAGVAGLYGYLYVLLMNEDYALLAGSIGLFVLLALVMWVTRRVDWNRLDARGQAPV
jgi:inner membrane protein